MKIFSLELRKLRYETLFNEIIKLEEKRVIFTPNPEIMLNAKKDIEFLDMLKKADYLTIDWVWIYAWLQALEVKNRFFRAILMPYFILKIFISKKELENKYWEKICWSDLTKDLLEYADKNWKKVVIIDLYNPDDTKKVESQKIAPQKLKQKFKNLDFIFKIYKENEKEEIINEINSFWWEIIFSTLGAKKQEESILFLIEKTNAKIWLWIGSSIDYLIWFQKRAPKIFSQIWLEWLYRIATSNRKIYRLKRLYNAIFGFLSEIVKQK